jgi:hypothetical protein
VLPASQQCPVRTGEATQKATVAAVTKLHVGFRSGNSLLLNFSVHPITLLGYPLEVSSSPIIAHNLPNTSMNAFLTVEMNNLMRPVLWSFFENVPESENHLWFRFFWEITQYQRTVRSGYFKKC